MLCFRIFREGHYLVQSQTAGNRRGRQCPGHCAVFCGLRHEPRRRRLGHAQHGTVRNLFLSRRIRRTGTSQMAAVVSATGAINPGIRRRPDGPLLCRDRAAHHVCGGATAFGTAPDCRRPVRFLADSGNRDTGNSDTRNWDDGYVAPAIACFQRRILGLPLCSLVNPRRRLSRPSSQARSTGSYPRLPCAGLETFATRPRDPLPPDVGRSGRNHIADEPPKPERTVIRSKGSGQALSEGGDTLANR